MGRALSLLLARSVWGFWVSLTFFSFDVFPFFSWSGFALDADIMADDDDEAAAPAVTESAAQFAEDPTSEPALHNNTSHPSPAQESPAPKAPKTAATTKAAPSTS